MLNFICLDISASWFPSGIVLLFGMFGVPLRFFPFGQPHYLLFKDGAGVIIFFFYFISKHENLFGHSFLFLLKLNIFFVVFQKRLLLCSFIEEDLLGLLLGLLGRRRRNLPCGGELPLSLQSLLGGASEDVLFGRQRNVFGAGFNRMCLTFKHGIFLFLGAGLMRFALGQTLLDEAAAIVHSLYISN